jgi:hypothetical protein
MNIPDSDFSPNSGNGYLTCERLSLLQDDSALDVSCPLKKNSLIAEAAFPKRSCVMQRIKESSWTAAPRAGAAEWMDVESGEE